MKKWIFNIIIIICLGVFCYSGYQLYLIFAENNVVKKETKELKEIVNKATEEGTDIDWDALKAKNEDIVAWIYIPDCDISYPVVQGDDNAYYLTHTIEKQYNNNGSVFLDYQNNPAFLDDNSIMYGHSVEGGGMCTDLKKYADESFFNEHKTIYFLTPDANYECDVFVFAKTLDSSEYYTRNFGDGRESLLNTWKTNALYVNEVDETKNFITLSTCDLDYGFQALNRFVLVSTLEKTDKPITVE